MTMKQLQDLKMNNALDN